MGAVIDGRAHARLSDRIAGARADAACSVVAGGGARSEVGWFVEPTLIETSDPDHALMREELFGPVLTVWVYPDGEEAAALGRCDRTSPYGLTGAIFARDRGFLETASRALRFAAGNLYINDKPTGAVVSQQPFGGARGSGTNDKAGSLLNLLRWVSPLPRLPANEHEDALFGFLPPQLNVRRQHPNRLFIGGGRVGETK